MYKRQNKKLFIGIGTGGSGGSATTIEAIGGSGSFADLFTSRTQNTFLAAPDGSNGAATFRAMVAADVPSLAHTKISDFDTGVRTNRLDQMTAPSAAVSFNSQKITNLADPTADADAATAAGFVAATWFATCCASGSRLIIGGSAIELGASDAERAVCLSTF